MGRAEPRVLALSTVADGCALYRIWMPLVALRHAGWDARWIPEAELEPWHLYQTDVLVVPRLGGDPDQVMRLVADARRARCRLVYECDDDLWSPALENPAYAGLVAHADAMRILLRECDAATTTNAVLAGRLRAEAGRRLPVYVLPNAVDPRVWATAGGGRTDHRLTVGVHGAHSHARDWEPLLGAFRAVAERHPEVRLLCGGYTPPGFERVPGLLSVPFQPLAAYPHLVAELDIACCPLEDTAFNRSKSPIKWLESAMAGAAGVVSETVYGPAVRSAGGRSVAAIVPRERDRDPDAWAEAILRLVEDDALRSRMRKAARAAVAQRFAIANRWPGWARAYREIAAGSPGLAGPALDSGESGTDARQTAVGARK